MIYQLPYLARVSILLGAAMIAINGVTYAGGPEEYSAQKGGKCCDHSPCRHTPCYHKPCLHRLMPPMLPVIQSQAVRSVPAESASRLQLQVKAAEAERSREPFREEGRPSEQFRSDDGLPTQKGHVPTQKASYLSGSTVSSDLDERFARLESQVSLLLQRFDGLVEQQAQRQSPLKTPSED